MCVVINAADVFANATTMLPVSRTDPTPRKTLPLVKTTEPEEKRKIIGDTFIGVCTPVTDSPVT